MTARHQRSAEQEPLRIRLTEHAQALALTGELALLGSVDLEPRGDGWEISLDCPKTDGLVVRVLDAVRRALAGRPETSAQVLLDGHSYQMQGESA